MIMLSLALVATVSLMAQKIQTFEFSPEPQMHCNNCEKKITEGLKYVKGVKSIKTDVATNTVSVDYNAEKTSPEKIMAALPKVGYKAAPKCEKAAASCCKGDKGCDKAKECRAAKNMKCGEGKDCCKEKAAPSCCKDKKPADNAKGCTEAKECCKQKEAAKK